MVSLASPVIVNVVILFPDDDDVNKAIEFSPVKMPGGNSSEPFHKNQKLMWNQKVAVLIIYCMSSFSAF